MAVNGTGAYGILLLRVTLGTVLLTHSVLLKLVTFTLPGTAAFFESTGLPGWLAYLVFATEAIAGSMLVVGVGVRWAALAVVPILLGATWVHAGNGWVFDAPGGGWEYPLVLAILAVVQSLLGGGAWALQRYEPLQRAAAAGT